MHTAGTNLASDLDVQGALDHMRPICLPYITSEWADIVPIFLGHLTSAMHALSPGRSLTKAYDAQPVHPPAACIVHPSPAVAPASSLLAPVVVTTSVPLLSAPSPIMHSGSSDLGLSQLAPPSLCTPSSGPRPSPLTIVGPEFLSASASLLPMHIVVCPVEPCPDIILLGDNLSDSAPIHPAKHGKSSSCNAAHPAGFNKAELISKADLPASYTSCRRCWDMKKRCAPLCTAKPLFGDCGHCVHTGEFCVWLGKAKEKAKEQAKEQAQEKAKEKAKPTPRAAGTLFL